MKTKKMLKRMMSVLLACVLIFGSAPIGALLGLDLFSLNASAITYGGICGDNLTWTLDTNTGELVISGTGAMTNWGDFSYVPWDSCRSYIKTVTIGDSVTSIGGSAFFNCESLTSIIIPDSVTSIGDYAFFDCYSLTSITIPDSVTSIGDYAFENCDSLESVTIPDSVTSIGRCVFWYCDSLVSVVIGNSVTSIGDYAFYYCSSLTNVVIGNSVTSIGNYAFRSCSSLTNVVIGNSVTSIGNYAFCSCSSLTSVTIGNSVTSIGEDAFWYCYRLKTVYYTGDLAGWCSVSFGNSHSNPMNYADSLYIDGELLSGDIVIPKEVTSIGNCAFRGCDSLTSVTIPDSVTSIGDQAFAYCTGLTNVTIGYGIKSIGDYAFIRCNKLVDIYYNGTESQWQNVSIGSTNDILAGDAVKFIHVHKYTENITKQPTCTEKGSANYSCKTCEYSYTDEIPATGHSHESKVTKAPTCTETGIKTFTCHCGDSYTEVIKANGHTKGKWEYIGGKEYAKLCTVCGDKLESKQITVNMLINGENVNKKQILNKSTSIVTANVTDNFTSDIVFVSSDDSTVSVDANGNVTANDVGKATITVTINGTAISDSIEIVVLPRDFTITWIVNGTETVQTVKEYEEIIPEVNTNVEGYMFKGWNAKVPETMPSENLTFTALLELIVPVSVRIAKAPSKTEYNYKQDNINISEIELEVTYSDGTKDIIKDTSAMTVSGFSNEKIGKQIVTVEYEGLTVEYEVTVKYTWWQWILVILLFGWIWY